VINRLLFKLAEENARSVYQDEQGIFKIDSAVATDDYKKNYDVFVYDLHDNKLFAAFRRFFNRQYSLLFAPKIKWVTKIFSVIFFPFYRLHDYGAILDVGCSTGLFLEYLPNEWRKYGLELNTKAAVIARQRGVNVTVGGLESFQADTKFDVIRISHVLEHIKDYKNFLAVAANLLKPGGILVIYTPNSESFSRKLAGRFWSGFYDQTHFTIFNYKNLLNSVFGLGLEVVFRSTYYMGYLGDSLMRILKIKKGRIFFIYLFYILFFPVSFLERCFNKSDALTVYFKKSLV
jgi:SAM-dependent methyltransferase